MNLKQVKYVRTLAQIGSFSGAAEVLEISQPSLSQYIKKIEQELGVELFERANGRVRITDAGKVYLGAGEKMLKLEADMQNQIKDVAEHKAGSITIGTSPFRCITMMPEIVRRFQKEYPGMHLSIREMTTQELMEATEHGEFDICLTNLPVDETQFCYDVVMEEEILLAVKKGSHFDTRLQKAIGEKQMTVDAALLDGEAFVMLTEQQMMQKELINLCHRFKIQLKTAVVVKSLEAQIEMVSAGIGSAIVPMGIRKSSRMEKEITFYSFAQNMPKRTLAVVYQKEKYLTKPMRDLIEIIKDNREVPI